MAGSTTGDIVAKLWNLCNVLKDDGVTYHQYVTELTYLLFLKMAKETGREEGIPAEWRWDVLETLKGLSQFNHYKELLLKLGSSSLVIEGTDEEEAEEEKEASPVSPIVTEIYANASTFIKKPVTLKKLVDEIDKLDWYSARQEGLGDLYEGLLQKNAEEKKSGAGQYFTPRPLIDAMVAVMQPRLGDVIQDPAAGTGGFLIAAQHWIREHQDISELDEVQQKRFYQSTFYGMEHVQDTHRLALMNLMLHGLDSVSGEGGIRYGDTLSSDGEGLPKASLILTNPPFGTKKGGGLPSRTDFTFPTSNKQFCFLQHIYRALQPGGRAAVVLPDNVLFEGNVGKQIRADLMDKCNLHTILRLPTGIFYAQGVKTNVLFFTRGSSEKGNTKEVWVYDLRANMPAFGKRTPLTREHFADFEAAYGSDPLGLVPRTATGPEGRWQCFSREEIAARGDSLDLAWLKDDSAEDGADLPEPALLAQEAMEELEGALEDLRAILAELGEELEELV
ncbi:MAG: SAM-dependent methyltransferase [Cyanobium sp. CACIAM 14]|nr:MAG: SAM-dependent methyltransferase [Cyanobium sp. CACIAM 14]